MDLLNIRVSEDKSIIELKEFGFDLEIDEISKKAVNTAATLALKAFQTAVPVDTGMLSDRDIQIDFAKKNQATFSAKVYVANNQHVTSRSNIYSPELARVLDQGKGKSVAAYLKRTKDSVPKSPYSTIFHARTQTEGWISEGYNLFLNQLARTNL